MEIMLIQHFMQKILLIKLFLLKLEFLKIQFQWGDMKLRITFKLNQTTVY